MRETFLYQWFNRAYLLRFSSGSGLTIIHGNDTIYLYICSYTMRLWIFPIRSFDSVTWFDFRVICEFVNLCAVGAVFPPLRQMHCIQTEFSVYFSFDWFIYISTKVPHSPYLFSQTLSWSIRIAKPNESNTTTTATVKSFIIMILCIEKPFGIISYIIIWAFVWNRDPIESTNPTTEKLK